MVISYDVTRRALALGGVDGTTGWYSKTWNTSTIKMIILKRGASLIGLPAGLYPKHDYTGWTEDPIAEGDEILDSNTNYYLVNSVTPIWLGDSLYCYECELVKSPLHGDRPTTSGTWVSVGDPSYRVKVWLDTGGVGLVAANMKEDDNATNASTLTAFGFPDYPLYHVFINKGVDLVFSIGPSNGTPERGYDKLAHHNEEHTPITLCCIDKAGITARRLLWAGIQELRRIGTTALGVLGTGSVRIIASDKPTTQNLGSTVLYSTEVIIDWFRDLT